MIYARQIARAECVSKRTYSEWKLSATVKNTRIIGAILEDYLNEGVRDKFAQIVNTSVYIRVS